MPAICTLTGILRDAAGAPFGPAEVTLRPVATDVVVTSASTISVPVSVEPIAVDASGALTLALAPGHYRGLARRQDGVKFAFTVACPDLETAALEEYIGRQDVVVLTSAQLARDAAQAARDGAAVERAGAEAARLGAEGAGLAASEARDAAQDILDLTIQAAAGGRAFRAATLAQAVAAGLAGTAVGDTFTAAGDDTDDLVIYSHDAGPAATEIARLPSSDTVRAVQAVVPGVPSAGVVIPIAAAGGDAVIWHRPDGVDLLPSAGLDGRLGVGRAQADGVVPIAAAGGDAVIWHRPDGVDLLPSAGLEGRLGVGRAQADGVVPIAAAGGDAVIWHRPDGVDLLPSAGLDQRLGVGRAAADGVVPIAAAGGDAVIWHRPDGVDLLPSAGLDQRLGVGRAQADGVVPIAAAGGDAVIWHRPDGVDLLPSAGLDGRLGVGRAQADGVVPIAAAGGDAVIWHRPDGVDLLPSAALLARLTGLPDPAITAPPPVTDGQYLRRTRARVAALRLATAGVQLHVLMVGDSWTALPHLITALGAVLGATHPVVGDGFLSSNTVQVTQTGATYAKSAGWTVLDATGLAMPLGVTPDGMMLHTDADDQTATWTDLRCTRLSIYVRAHGGTWRYRVDGGSWTTVEDESDGALKRVQITGLADTPHTVEIDTVGNTGTVALAGYFMHRAGAAGVVISRFANGGENALSISAYLPAQAVVLGHEPPDVILTVLGTNDARSSSSTPAVYVGYMTNLIGAAREVLSDVDMIHVVGPQNNLSVVRPITDYRDALWAARGTLQSEYLSLSEYYGAWAEANALGLWADDVHPSFRGARMIADLINDLIIRI